MEIRNHISCRIASHHERHCIENTVCCTCVHMVRQIRMAFYIEVFHHIHIEFLDYNVHKVWKVVYDIHNCHYDRILMYIGDCKAE